MLNQFSDILTRTRRRTRIIETLKGPPLEGPNNRTIWIFNFYRLCQIGYGYIDFYLIRIMDKICTWMIIDSTDLHRFMQI